ncbi:MAG: DedA family protein [Bacteroidetes bacterium]|nr:DedA family protein [Bacteroidota bacterium]MBU1421790.1 DedA family protein [Bacteroidota bacterium]MBU2635575.1 DedA family protein [Bacteroidota bacterium]
MEVDEIIQYLSQVEAIYVYLIIFAIAYIENIFPPSPSDVIVVFGGSMVALGKANFIASVFSAALGGLFGFITMYVIGRWFGRRILEKGKIKFIPLDKLHKVEGWFRKYGYGIIIANRFLTGTRAVVAFFAGLSELNLKITSILSFISAVVWNAILLYAGFTMGRNWQHIIEHLKIYGIVVTLIVLLTVIIWSVKILVNKKRSRNDA